LGCQNAYYLPGCRILAALTAVPERSPKPFRIIFLAHVTRLKGPLVLLEAMRTVAGTCSQEVSCDFYGPIVDEVHDEFVQGLKITPNAHYLGVAEPGTGPQLIANYDALILPTYYDTEGHPGVLIEAMHAGVPVISTQIRTLPELVTDGVNGLLVPTQDSQALAEAIKRLAEHPEQAKQMGEANRRRGEEFRADAVVAQMLKMIFPKAYIAPSRH
jgi:glycosyltransferase involved in cell wall biosynthesis